MDDRGLLTLQVDAALKQAFRQACMAAGLTMSATAELQSQQYLRNRAKKMLIAPNPRRKRKIPYTRPVQWTRLTLRLDPAIKKAFERVCEEEGQVVSQLPGQLIRQYLVDVRLPVAPALPYCASSSSNGEQVLSGSSITRPSDLPDTEWPLIEPL